MAVKDTAFGEKLRKWRGKRLQKEAADILGVPVMTLRNWEWSRRKPAKTCQTCIERKMVENP